VIPVCVLVKVDYWVHKVLGASTWQVMTEDIDRGAYHIAELTVADLTRAAELGAAYPNLDLGLVDASVIALTERLNETKVATLDRRDFSVVRPRHCDTLRLLPRRGSCVASASAAGFGVERVQRLAPHCRTSNPDGRVDTDVFE